MSRALKSQAADRLIHSGERVLERSTTDDATDLTLHHGGPPRQSNVAGLVATEQPAALLILLAGLVRIALQTVAIVAGHHTAGGAVPDRVIRIRRNIGRGGGQRGIDMRRCPAILTRLQRVEEVAALGDDPGRMRDPVP